MSLSITTTIETTSEIVQQSSSVSGITQQEQSTAKGEFPDHEYRILCVSEHVNSKHAIILMLVNLLNGSFPADKFTIYSQEPELHDLMSHIARETPTKWYEVGIQLKIKTSMLDGFEEQTRDQARLYIKMFEQWRRGHEVPYTWTTIIDALEAVGERTVASDIREWLRGHTRT